MTVDMVEVARRIRRDVIQMIAASQSGHPGGALGAAEILSVLYFDKMNHNPKNPDWPARDRFVLSNGHICAALYSALARSGYFPVEELLTFRRLNSRLQGHPSRHDLPGIETAAGPLGQGLSIANGMALGLRLQNVDAKVYCLVGDGEIQEGQFWEAAMTSAHYRLNNLALILSWNGLQIDGAVADVKNMEPIAAKFQAFGWNVVEIDGHDIPQIQQAFEEFSRSHNQPTAIIARTVMGKGVSFMEDKALWHGKAPSRDEAARALQEIGPSSFGEDLDIQFA
ncbi:MAG: transketolase [Thermoflavifilum sp.]|nr:transketolase [Thermoflavifilum sp.]MCL6514587.1 transketolase [Alicyclobacillus sp.]